MILPADRHRLLACARQQPVDRLGDRQPAGRRAGHLRIDGLADREVDLRGIEVGEPAAQPRLGLRHVGRGHVAGIETFAGGAERLAQKRRVDALGFHQGLVGEHVGIGSDGVEQHALADIAQGLASRAHIGLGLAHGIRGLEAVEQRLRDRQADGPGAQRCRLHGVVGKQHPHLLQAAGQHGHDLRPVGRDRHRNGLVDSA